MSGERKPNFIQRGLVNASIGFVAARIAEWLDGLGDLSKAISPEQLEALAQADKPVILGLIATAPPEALAGARAMFKQIAPFFGKEDFRLILAERCLAVDHAAHVAVLVRHWRWYRDQMEEARDYLAGHD